MSPASFPKGHRASAAGPPIFAESKGRCGPSRDSRDVFQTISRRVVRLVLSIRRSTTFDERAPSIVKIPWSTIIFILGDATAAPWARFACSAVGCCGWHRRSTAGANPRKLSPPAITPPGVRGPQPESTLTVGEARRGERSTLVTRHVHSCIPLSISIRSAKNLLHFPLSCRSHSCAFVASSTLAFPKALTCPFRSLLLYSKPKTLSFFPVCQRIWASRHSNPVGDRGANLTSIDSITIAASSQP